MQHPMTRINYCITLALSVLLLSACNDSRKTTDTAPTDPELLLLVPGESAGPYRLGDADSLLHQQLGNPDYSDAAMGKAVLFWNIDPINGYTLSVYVTRNMGNDETARIKQIRTTSPFFETAEAIHVGSSLADINNQYQITPVETNESDSTYSIYKTNEGIAFEIGSGELCTAIIVHHPDDAPISYLPLRRTD